MNRFQFTNPSWKHSVAICSRVQVVYVAQKATLDLPDHPASDAFREDPK